MLHEPARGGGDWRSLFSMAGDAILPHTPASTHLYGSVPKIRAREIEIRPGTRNTRPGILLPPFTQYFLRQILLSLETIQ